METGEPIEEPNKLGKVVMTAFDRMGQPCVRYDTKDVAMWSENKCSLRPHTPRVQGRNSGPY